MTDGPVLEDPPDDPEPWETPTIYRALHAAIPGVMPAQSLALYARWWQLETWLRELTYVELRARLGQAWADVVRAAFGRQAQDAAYTHMTGPDSENPLAYLDYSQLAKLIEDHWDQFEPSLFERKSWQGRQEELKRVRHRISHMRVAHADDQSRIEQTLRDLERGTFIALAAYNRRRRPNVDEHADPVTTGWVKGEHPIASRLIQHASRSYDIGFSLHFSVRPWVKNLTKELNAPGILWHAEYHLGTRSYDAFRLWQDLYSVRPLLMHMVTDTPHSVEFTFCAADDPSDVSDAIGHTFDAVLGAARNRYINDDTDPLWKRWAAEVRSIDYRVLAETGWNIVGDSTVPISNFGAGGGIKSHPLMRG